MTSGHWTTYPSHAAAFAAAQAIEGAILLYSTHLQSWLLLIPTTAETIP